MKRVMSQTTHTLTQKLFGNHIHLAHDLSLAFIPPAKKPSLTLVAPKQKNASLPTHHLPSLCLSLVLEDSPTLPVSHPSIPPCLSQHRRKSRLGYINEDWAATCVSSMPHRTLTPKK